MPIVPLAMGHSAGAGREETHNPASQAGNTGLHAGIILPTRVVVAKRKPSGTLAALALRAGAGEPKCPSAEQVLRVRV